MALETATYIDGLVATNPESADLKSQGDDHIRLVKSTLLATFPAITGAVTSTHTELNILDGVTATTTELNILDGVTATTAELNVLDGITATVTELNYTDGVTSAIQGQIDLKAPLASPALTGNPTAPTPTAGDNDTSIATTAFVQGELVAKAPLASPALTGTPTAPTASSGTNNTQVATTAFATQLAFATALPAQTGNANKFITTDGTTASWEYTNIHPAYYALGLI